MHQPPPPRGYHQPSMNSGPPRGAPPSIGSGPPGGFPPSFNGGAPRGAPPSFNGGAPRGTPPSFGSGPPRGAPPSFNSGPPGGAPPRGNMALTPGRPVMHISASGPPSGIPPRGVPSSPLPPSPVFSAKANPPQRGMPPPQSLGARPTLSTAPPAPPATHESFSLATPRTSRTNSLPENVTQDALPRPLVSPRTSSRPAPVSTLRDGSRLAARGKELALNGTPIISSSVQEPHGYEPLTPSKGSLELRLTQFYKGALQLTIQLIHSQSQGYAVRTGPSCVPPAVMVILPSRLL
jgi:hypothetical protein